jgi:hypothetical protein
MGFKEKQQIKKVIRHGQRTEKATNRLGSEILARYG